MDAKTEGAWWSHFKHSKHCTRVTDDKSTDIRRAITATKGDSWQGKPLSNFFNLDDLENEYMDP